MLTVTDYLVAWVVYLVSSVALMFFAWRLSARFWTWARDAVRVVIAVLLLTPAAVDGSGDHLAPALFVVAFELLSVKGGGIGPLLGVRMLLITLLAVLGAWVLRFAWYWLVLRPRAARTVAETSAASGAVRTRRNRDI